MLRRLAISLAATSAMVLTATAPAFADHVVPDEELSGNQSCGDLDPPLEGEKIDPPADVDNEDYTATLSDDGIFLDVTAKAGFVIDAVLVKGSDDTNLFLGPDFTHLFSPEAGGSGEPAQISHYEVCGHEDDDDDGNGGDDGENGDDGEENGEDGEENGEDGEENGEDGEENGEEPDAEETPATVPTAVPAGMSGSEDGGSMAPVGIAAAALMVVAGGAALLRRRFAHQS